MALFLASCPRLALVAVLAASVLLRASTSFADAPPEPASARVTGAIRTRERTVVELLPREPPSAYSDAELAETERRISNLGVFDRVNVTRQQGQVVIDVREKWTLIPDFALATGKTLADLSISLGATEYNVAGTGSALGVSVYREQRGLGFAAQFYEHESRHHRWAYGGLTSYGSSSLRFDHGNAWYLTLAETRLWATSFPLVGNHLRMRTTFTYAHEAVDDVEGAVRPPSGHALVAGLGLLWDAYRFDDLVPRGLLGSLTAGPGVFVPHAQPRAYVEGELLAALPLARYTVLTGRAAGSVTTRGNVNFSTLLGSIEGVRGLDDALYRNWAQAFSNVELRQAIPLFERLALQVVAFTDVGVFAELDARGARKGPGRALSGGLGARLIPTFLTQLLFRVDVARLVLPNQDWFVQLGVSQYFF